MTPQNSKTIAIVLTTVGIIFFIAMAFQVMAYKYAIFAGVTCFILATMVRRIAAQRE
jgi:hypothetical protein